MSAISIDKRYRNNYRVITNLLKGCINILDVLLERNIKIEKVMADAITIHGEKIWNKININKCKFQKCSSYYTCSFIKKREKMQDSKGAIICNHDLLLENQKRKVVENFLEKIENILKENTTETMVTKLERDKEKINKKLANLLELNLEGKINKEQYTEKFDNLNIELMKTENKIESLLKETNRNESIKQRLNKFKSLFKNIDIMPKFDKDVFESLINKVIIGEVAEDGRINPYTIRFICKNGTEINCKDKFTTMSDKQHSNNTATREKQTM